MTTSGPPVKRAHLSHTGGGLVFRGTWNEDADAHVVYDSDGALGPSPMDGLLMSLAACMAVDVKLILDRSRVPLDSLDVDATGVRNDTEPRRFTHVTLVYRLQGPGAADRPRVERALRLSKDKYCSVLHSLDPDLPIDVRVEGEDLAFDLDPDP